MPASHPDYDAAPSPGPETHPPRSPRHCAYTGLIKTKKSGLHPCHLMPNITCSNAEHVLRPHHLVTTKCPLQFPAPAATCPFKYVSTDLYGPLPSGEYLLAIMDHFKRYPNGSILHSTSYHTVLTHIRRVSATMAFQTPFSPTTLPKFQLLLGSEFY